MNIKTTYIIICMLMLFISSAHAQNDRQFIRQGNRQYRAQHYEKAEATYRKAVAANPRNPEAQYNLGCALMAQQKDSMAIQCLENGAKLQSDPIRRAQAYHNMGVICQQKKLFAEAAEAYKQALRNNPADDETRYNLALCLKQIKNQPQQQQQKSQDENEGDNKKNKDEEEKNDNQDKKQEPDNQEQMSKENAEQLLNAAQQQEKATQQRLKQNQQQPRRNKHLKNW